MNITFEPSSWQYGAHASLPLRCVRAADPGSWQQLAVFGRVCSAHGDLVNVPETQPPHTWDPWIMAPVKDEL